MSEEPSPRAAGMRARRAASARGRALRAAAIAGWVLAACATAPAGDPTGSVDPEAEVAAARALFDLNLAAIQAKDREAYLDCYRPTGRLIRSTASGLQLGYASLAEGTPATGAPGWPESLEATEVDVHWVAPGVVFGAYAFRVVFDGVETTGRSERVFLREDGRWFIAVSTAFPTVPEPDR